MSGQSGGIKIRVADDSGLEESVFHACEPGINTGALIDGRSAFVRLLRMNDILIQFIGPRRGPLTVEHGTTVAMFVFLNVTLADLASGSFNFSVRYMSPIVQLFCLESGSERDSGDNYERHGSVVIRQKADICESAILSANGLKGFRTSVAARDPRPC